ncbi:hypothetical protein [Marinobacter confluentis]|uniref:Uncharacterized protein n=1 Tax=Marinobacter confluentis TaxID=1697557 RepID=A0A4Z1BEZ8_9GAMM|nr:hypothetical protein [Marinobacter confluentis]TGN41274.1 hypothetical protein E5Q11_01595 [Marinobacter confluentis]
MIPDSLKQRYQSQVRPQFDRASGEFRKVLRDLGVSMDEERSLKEVVSQIRAKNPSFRELSLNLDMATYDLRKKLWWDANMLTAYAYDRAGKTFETEVAPRFNSARARAESEARRLFVQLREITGRKPAESDTTNDQ